MRKFALLFGRFLCGYIGACIMRNWNSTSQNVLDGVVKWSHTVSEMNLAGDYMHTKSGN